MAFQFGDGFDLYSIIADAALGAAYWDNTAAGASFVTGRFPGSRGLNLSNATNTLQKSSNVNDAVHHFNFAMMQPNKQAGNTSSQAFFINLQDGTNLQCCLTFGLSGQFAVTNGVNGSGTVLAGYTAQDLLPAVGIWYYFEIEVVINNTTGSVTMRRNGNTVADFSFTGINTRSGSTNNYVNRIILGTTFGGYAVIDDFLWRSDASSVAWLGELKCITRMPASDVSVQWTRSGTTVPLIPYAAGTTIGFQSNQARYWPFVARVAGTIGSATLLVSTVSTANVKMAIFASDGAGGAPGTVLATSNTVAGPTVGTQLFTFASPPTVVAGTTYYLAMASDLGTGAYNCTSANYATAYFVNGITFATWPTANPSVSSSIPIGIFTVNVTPTTIGNYQFVNEAQQDSGASYVASSTVSQSDLYSIGATPTPQANVYMVITIGLFQKTDAGTRNAAVQLKSGASAAVQGPSTALVGTWGWTWRNDFVDPNTSAAWTTAAVDALQIGPVLTA